MARKSDSRELLVDRGQHLRDLLNKVPGLQLTSSHHGVLESGKLAADVELEPDDWIRVSLAAPGDSSPRAALEANSRLDGNVRFAGRIADLRAIADTQVDGQSHLPESFRRIGRGLLQAATGKRSARRRAKPDIDPAVVQAAVDELGWEEKDVVVLEDEWELRPSFRGAVWPVRLSVDGPSLWVRRTVLEPVPSGWSGEVVADQALRLNREIRLARLAQCGDRLVAEARLHGGQISPDWLEAAAQAVAAAAWRAQPTLAALAHEPTAAQQYVAMFLS